MPDRPFRAKIGSLEYGSTFLRVDISEPTGRAGGRLAPLRFFIKDLSGGNAGANGTRAETF